MEQLLNKLKEQLAQTLPGQDAQYLMAPFNRERISLELLKVKEYRPSAVMVLFCRNAGGELFIPLIERMAYKGVHSAQMSLPGGKFEAMDGDLVHTAVRECFEEIGIQPIEVIGQLTPLHIPVSGFMVQPFVGICHQEDPIMITQEREVKAVVRLKLDTLMNNDSVKQGLIDTAQNMKINTHYFEVEAYKVWGATAMILSELKELMKSIGQ